MPQRSHFILNVLRDLQSRTESAARRHAELRHMLVLPPEEDICVPPGRTRAVGDGTCNKRSKTCEFGKTKLVGALPSRKSWPSGMEPLRAVVAEQHVQEPYRIHLFFGGNASAFNALQELADELAEIRKEIRLALFADDSDWRTVFYTSSDVLRSDRVFRLDSWVCTIHWWAWFWTECPFHTSPRVVLSGRTYPVDPREGAVYTKLAFSIFDADVLTASAVTLSLIQRFFDELPAVVRFANYPPVPEQSSDDTEPKRGAAIQEPLPADETGQPEAAREADVRREQASPAADDGGPSTSGPEPARESAGAAKQASLKRGPAGGLKWEQAMKRMLDLHKEGTLPDSVRKASAMLSASP